MAFTTLAMVIDDSVVNWILATGAVVIPSLGTGIVLLWRKLIAFLKPLIENFFSSHNRAFAAQTELAVEMKAQTPIVAQTLNSLAETQKKQCETQDRQCETLEQHGKILEQHNETMETILIEVRRSNPNQSQAK